MKKADQKRLDDALDKALAPPRRRPQTDLDALLDEYDDRQASELLTPSRESSTSSTSRPSRPSSTSIAPERDFTRVANSIVREAVPAGVFSSGKRKQLYDYLYSLTRGAIVPKRSIRISKEKLMTGADIGSGVTLRANLNHLRQVGLITEQVIPGTHGGNEYTVHLPEETPSTPSRASTPSSSGQKLETVEALETTASSGGLNADNISSYGHSKTSLKTEEKTIDDEPFGALIAAFQTAAKELTGKTLTNSEKEKLGELADLLIAELRIAATRTTVSSIPAFLTEHLRRRLWKKDKQQLHEEGKSKVAQSKSFSLEEIKKCSDCAGTGLYYPDGYERGVKKCSHDNLRDKKGE